MIFSSKAESWVFNKLSLGPKSTESLYAMQPPFTKRALYKAIASLLQKHVIIKGKATLALNLLWIEKTKEDLHKIEKSYHEKATVLSSLKEGASIKLNFTSFESLDDFWCHIILEFIATKPPLPYLFYEPDVSWWALYPKNARLFVKALIQYGYTPMIAFPNTITVNADIIKLIRGQGAQVAFVKPIGANNLYYNVFGDYIIETTFPKEEALKAQQHLEQKNYNISAAQHIIGNMKKFIIKITKSKTKAEQLKKQLRKDFIF